MLFLNFVKSLLKLGLIDKWTEIKTMVIYKCKFL